MTINLVSREHSCFQKTGTLSEWRTLFIYLFLYVQAICDETLAMKRPLKINIFVSSRV